MNASISNSNIGNYYQSILENNGKAIVGPFSTPSHGSYKDFMGDNNKLIFGGEQTTYNLTAGAPTYNINTSSPTRTNTTASSNENLEDKKPWEIKPWDMKKWSYNPWDIYGDPWAIGGQYSLATIRHNQNNLLPWERYQPSSTGVSQNTRLSATATRPWETNTSSSFNLFSQSNNTDFTPSYNTGYTTNQSGWRTNSAKSLPLVAYSSGNDLADAAAQTALIMEKTRDKNNPLCARGVRQTLQATGLVSKNVGYASAYQWEEELSRNPNFEEVKVKRNELKNLPPGYVVIWDNSKSKHGHISITLGDGKEASDHIQKQIVNHGNFKVYKQTTA